MKAPPPKLEATIRDKLMDWTLSNDKIREIVGPSEITKLTVLLMTTILDLEDQQETDDASRNH